MSIQRRTQTHCTRGIRASEIICSTLKSGRTRVRDDLGLLVIDLLTRRRLRLNGVATLADGKINLHTEQVYFNCPKYIQKRDLDISPTQISTISEVRKATELTSRQQQWMMEADTFFIASFHPSGADTSHRGGHPGFVQPLTPRKLVFPDYSGNHLFNTLGNLIVNPQSGLLFINFEQGHIP